MRWTQAGRGHLAGSHESKGEEHPGPVHRAGGGEVLLEAGRRGLMDCAGHSGPLKAAQAPSHQWPLAEGLRDRGHWAAYS